MKFLALLCAPAFIIGVIGGAFHGNPIAVSIIFGFVAPIALATAVACAPAKRRPRRADPAKVARLERELGVGPAWEWKANREREASEAPTEVVSPYEAKMREWGGRVNVVDTEPCDTCGAGPGECFAEPLPCAREAPTEPDTLDDPAVAHGVFTGCTTMLAEPDVEDCPRPAACVTAHPCRKCGADRGEACQPTGKLPMTLYEGTKREAMEIMRARYSARISP